MILPATRRRLFPRDEDSPSRAGETESPNCGSGTETGQRKGASFVRPKAAWRECSRSRLRSGCGAAASLGHPSAPGPDHRYRPAAFYTVRPRRRAVRSRHRKFRHAGHWSSHGARRPEPPREVFEPHRRVARRTRNRGHKTLSPGSGCASSSISAATCCGVANSPTSLPCMAMTVCNASSNRTAASARPSGVPRSI